MNERRKPKVGWNAHVPWPDADVMFPRSPEIMAEMWAWAFAQRDSPANVARRARVEAEAEAGKARK